MSKNYYKLINGLKAAFEHEEKEEECLMYYRAKAENVKAVQYGNDTSRGTVNGDRLQNDVIKIEAYTKKFAPERRERFMLRAEASLEFAGFLETDEAELMRMRHTNQMTVRQIADKVGMSVGWVSQRISAAEEKLKKVL